MEKLLAAEASLDGWIRFSDDIKKKVADLINLLEQQRKVQEYISNPETEDPLLTAPGFVKALQNKLQLTISDLFQKIFNAEQRTRNSFKMPLTINSDNIPVNDLMNSQLLEVIQDINRVILLQSATFRSSLVSENTNLIENSLKIDLEEELHLRTAINHVKFAFQKT